MLHIETLKGMKRILSCCIAVLAATFLIPAHAADTVTAKVGVLRIDHERPLPLSRLDLPPDDLGFAGAALGESDNNTTGRFLGQAYEVVTQDTTPDEAAATMDTMIDDGIGFIVIMGDAQDVLDLSDHADQRNVLLFNAQAEDDILRTDECRANVLHVASSRAMMADGLAQFLMWKRWRNWFMIVGSHPADEAWAEALRRAASRFGAKIVEERVFEDTGGARRTDTGHVLVQKQIPVFTQRANKHDVVIAADESDVFAGHLPYHTWDARPVAGSAGLRPVGWHAGNEAWGATQFQRRFEKIAERRVRTLDFQVWLALRVIGEGVTRTSSADPETVRDYVLSDDFELGIFKGTKVGFRPWNQQIRSPVLLANDRMIVSVSPQKEYLHKVSQLDTLGYDEPESRCSLN